MNWYAAAVSWRRKGLILPQQSLSLSPSRPPTPPSAVHTMPGLPFLNIERVVISNHQSLPAPSVHLQKGFTSCKYTYMLYFIQCTATLFVPSPTADNLWSMKKRWAKQLTWRSAECTLPVSLCPAPAQRQPLPLVVTRVHCWGWEQRTGKD